MCVHCCNHSLDIALQEVAHEVNLAEGLNFVHGVTVLIKKSAKHKQPIESIFVKTSSHACAQKDIVCERKRCCSSSVLLATLESLMEDRSARGAIVAELHKQELKSKTLCSLHCNEALFGPCEAVAKRAKRLL